MRHPNPPRQEIPDSEPDADIARIDSVYETGWSSQLGRGVSSLPPLDTLLGLLDVLLYHPRCYYTVSQTCMPHWLLEHRKSLGIEPPRVRNPSGPHEFNSMRYRTRSEAIVKDSTPCVGCRMASISPVLLYSVRQALGQASQV